MYYNNYYLLTIFSARSRKVCLENQFNYYYKLYSSIVICGLETKVTLKIYFFHLAVSALLAGCHVILKKWQRRTIKKIITNATGILASLNILWLSFFINVILRRTKKFMALGFNEKLLVTVVIVITNTFLMEYISTK